MVTTGITVTCRLNHSAATMRCWHNCERPSAMPSDRRQARPRHAERGTASAYLLSRSPNWTAILANEP